MYVLPSANLCPFIHLVSGHRDTRAFNFESHEGGPHLRKTRTMVIRVKVRRTNHGVSWCGWDMCAVKPKPHGQPTFRATDLRHISGIQTEEVTGTRLAIEHHTQEEPGVFLLVVCIRDENGLPRCVLRHAPYLDIFGIGVNLGQAVLEGGLSSVSEDDAGETDVLTRPRLVTLYT